MDKQGVAETACKGEGKHHGVVHSEPSHIEIAVECAPANAEIAVRNEQSALIALKVFDDELVAAVVYTVYYGVAVSGLEAPDALAATLLDGLGGVVDDECEKHFLALVAVY